MSKSRVQTKESQFKEMGAGINLRKVQDIAFARHTLNSATRLDFKTCKKCRPTTVRLDLCQED
jgi:hypothetical protein